MIRDRLTMFADWLIGMGMIIVLIMIIIFIMVVMITRGMAGTLLFVLALEFIRDMIWFGGEVRSVIARRWTKLVAFFENWADKNNTSNREEIVIVNFNGNIFDHTANFYHLVGNIF
jgi:hypothetical protein